MKKKLLFIFIALLFSCSRESENEIVKDSLTNKNWYKDYYETFQYENDILVEDKIDTEDKNKIYLNFSSTGSVNYFTPAFTEIIKGNWLYSENKTWISTDLKISLSSGTGYGTVYFFPKQKIVLINENQLILESPITYSTYLDGQTGTIKNFSTKVLYHFKR